MSVVVVEGAGHLTVGTPVGEYAGWMKNLHVFHPAGAWRPNPLPAHWSGVDLSPARIEGEGARRKVTSATGSNRMAYGVERQARFFLGRLDGGYGEAPYRGNQEEAKVTE